jgi:hypothetical protein
MYPAPQSFSLGLHLTEGSLDQVVRFYLRTYSTYLFLLLQAFFEVVDSLRLTNQWIFADYQFID